LDAVTTIATERIVAVVRARSIADAGGLAKTLLALEVSCLEITMTTAGALEAIEGARAAGAVVGAGTILDPDEATAAIDAGAQFLVSPVTDDDCMAVARRSGIPIVPGALTPTEILNAHRKGAAAVKLFPARTLGPPGVRDLHAIFPKINLIPSGGVDAENAGAYLQSGALAVFAGGAALPAHFVESGQHDALEVSIAKLVAAVRSSPPNT